MSESAHDGDVAGSAQRDFVLFVIEVGVEESVHDGDIAGSDQRCSFFFR